MIDDYIDSHINRGNSKGYANIILRNTKPFFKWLTLKEYINKCPYDGIQLLKVDKKKMDPIPEEDFKKLISIPPRNYFGSRDVLIMETLYGCGLRIGECLNLKLGNVDFKNNRLILEDTKNGEDSYVPFTKHLEKHLRDYIDEYLSSDSDDRFVFQNQDGNGLSYRSFESNLKKYCQKVKIPLYKCHQFRHNFAMAWIQANGDVASLQRVLRHKDPKMVNIYLSWTDKAITKEMLDHNPLDRLYDKE
jgi:integrase/recombinase XerD